jgi:hypothetical protein
MEESRRSSTEWKKSRRTRDRFNEAFIAGNLGLISGKQPLRSLSDLILTDGKPPSAGQVAFYGNVCFLVVHVYILMTSMGKWILVDTYGLTFSFFYVEKVFIIYTYRYCYFRQQKSGHIII